MSIAPINHQSFNHGVAERDKALVRSGAAIKPVMAETSITNLRLRTFIGFNPDEKTKQQDVVLNMHIRHRTRIGIYEDRVEDALDYKALTKKVISLVENGCFLLLEKLAGDVLDICARDERVVFARVTIDKPHALRFADSVSITMEYFDEDNA